MLELLQSTDNKLRKDVQQCVRTAIVMSKGKNNYKQKQFVAKKLR